MFDEVQPTMQENLNNKEDTLQKQDLEIQQTTTGAIFS